MERYGKVLKGMVWYGMCGVVWYGKVWYGMLWYSTVWYDIQYSIIIDFLGTHLNTLLFKQRYKPTHSALHSS